MTKPGYTLINLDPDIKGDRWMPNLWRSVARGELVSGKGVQIISSIFAERVACYQDLNIRLDLGAPIIKEAGLILSCDNLVAETALALDIPAIVLFGLTSPCDERYIEGWLADRHRFIWNLGGLPCIGVIELEKEIASLRRTMLRVPPTPIFNGG